MAERGQFACDDSETPATMHALHASEFPGPYTVRKNYLARRDGATWRLTELSNVVAYTCRHSRTEDRHHGHRSDFLCTPPAGDQRFGHQRFSSAKMGCANCANPRHGGPIRYRDLRESVGLPTAQNNGCRPAVTNVSATIVFPVADDRTGCNGGGGGGVGRGRLPSRCFPRASRAKPGQK